MRTAFERSAKANYWTAQIPFTALVFGSVRFGSHRIFLLASQKTSARAVEYASLKTHMAIGLARHYHLGEPASF